MKNIKLFAVCAIFAFLGLSNSYGQDPSFKATWSGCNLQVSESHYELTWAIWDISLDEVVATNQDTPLIYLQSVNSANVDCITSWDCNQSSETKNYILIVQVELLKDAEYCSGIGRSNPLTCSELYNYNTTVKVLMTY